MTGRYCVIVMLFVYLLVIWGCKDLAANVHPQELKALKHLLAKNNINATETYINRVITWENGHVVSLRLENIHFLDSSLGVFSKLRTLEIDTKNVHRLPDNIKNLSSLTTLYLPTSGLDSFPTVVCSIPNLKVLHLYNHTWKELPDALGTMKLDTLYYYDWCHKKRFPPHIAEIETLRKIHLEMHEYVASYFPVELTALKNLESLVFRARRIDTLSADIETVTNLRELDIRSSGLRYVSPALYTLKALETLNLHNNKLALLPEGIPKLTALQRLVLSENTLTQLPDDLVDWHSFTERVITDDDAYCVVDGNLLCHVPEKQDLWLKRVVGEKWRNLHFCSDME